MSARVHAPLRQRRNFLRAAGALAAGALAPRAIGGTINPPALLENLAGSVRILPAGGAFCGGAVPAEGYEIVHALLAEWVPLTDAWTLIERHLQSLGRPVQALCGMELRSPEQLTLDGFRAFNAPYIAELRKRDLVLGNYSAVCRTNVVPASKPPKAPMLHAFSYSQPTKSAMKTFCISGAADLDSRGDIVAPGDTSPKGMRERLSHCVEAIGERLAQLELDWNEVTHIDVCLVHDAGTALDELLRRPPAGALPREVRVHAARPPIEGTEVELECRAAAQELVVKLA